MMIPGSDVTYQSREAMMLMGETYKCPAVKIPPNVHYISNKEAKMHYEIIKMYMAVFYENPNVEIALDIMQ